MTFYNPPCIHPIDARWPWPSCLPGVELAELHFKQATFREEHFKACDIEVPPDVSRAAVKRKVEYLGGRLCAREALQRLKGISSAPSRHDDGSPHWPDSVVGSITHSDGRAAAVVGSRLRYSGLGLDSEKLIADGRANRLLPRVLTVQEQRRFSAELTDNPGLLLTQVFSLKESLFKALYPLTHQRFYFTDAELVTLSPTGEARLRLLTDLSDVWRAGAAIDGQSVIREQRVLSLINIPA